MLLTSIKNVLNLGIFFKILFFYLFQISFSLSQNISSSFHLNSDIIFINQNNKNFYIEIYFINYESALFSLNQIKINNILLEKSNCNINLNKVICLISKNNLNESQSNDIYIKLNGQNKVIKIKKIYYTIEILENNLILNILSKEKFLIKIKEKIIKSLKNNLNNFSKYEIDNKLLKENENTFINISIYNKNNNRTKVGEIYENFKDFNIRQLENNNASIEPKCMKYKEKMSFNVSFTENIEENNVINITIKNDTETISSTWNKVSSTTIICNITDNVDLGNYSVTIEQNNNNFTLDFSVVEDIKLNQTFSGINRKEDPKPFSFTNIPNKTLLGEFTSNKDILIITPPSDYEFSVELNSSVKNLNQFIGLYYKNGCEDVLLCVFNIYSNILNYSNALNLVNSINTTKLELEGTCNKSFIQSIILYQNDTNNINITSNNFTDFECGNENKYHFNVTFNLTTLTIKDVKIFNARIKYSDNQEKQITDFSIPIFNCSEGFEANDSIRKCEKCIEKEKNYSYISKSCTSNCNNDEYFFYDSKSCNKSCPGKYKIEETKTCYDDCTKIEGVYFINDNSKWECKHNDFILNLPSINIEWNETISVNFRFNDPNIINITKNKNYSINITIDLNQSKISSFDCKDTNNVNEIQCKFDLSGIYLFADFNISYTITFKNKTIVNKIIENAIKITISKYFCDKSLQKFENNSCHVCGKTDYEANNNKLYYYNFDCHEKCNSSDENYKYSFVKNATYRCISKDLCINNYFYLINPSDNSCVSECGKKEGIYGNECINCSTLGKEYGLYYNHSCIICSDEEKESYNGECKCFSGYGYDENNICIKCNETEGKKEINRDCMCREGLIDNNTICELIENYYNGTKITCNTYNPCGMINQNGSCDDSLEIPFCKCNDNYIGLYCQIEIKELKNRINDLNNSIISFINNNNYSNDIEYIQNNNLNIYVKEFSNLYLYLNELFQNEAAEKIINMTYNIINNFTLNNSIHSNITNIIDYIGFSYFYQQKYSSNTLRILNNNLNDNQIINFYNILFNETAFLNKTKTFRKSSNGVFSYFLFNNTENIIEEYIKECERNNIPYLSNKINNSVNYILHLVKNKNGSSNDILTHSYIFFYDENNTDITYKFKKEFKLNFELISFYENNILLNYYLKKGINIYDSRDIAFRDECYRTTKFNFDLLSKFRISLFQGEFYSESCPNIYINNNNEYTITFICDTSNNEFSYYLRNKSSYNINLKEYRSSFLSLHCFLDAQDIGRNIAFWIYLILMILFVTFSILLFKNKNYKLEELFAILNNDQLEIKTPNRYEEYEELRSNHKNKIDYYEFTTGNNSYFNIIKFNILHYHPLLIINKTSFLCPKWLNCLILIFNIANIFGFNCLLYTNTYLEKRIYNKYRNNFTYPLNNEFLKLFFTILISLILTILMKGLNLISYSEARAISLSMIKNYKINQIFIEKNAYNKFYMRIAMTIIIFSFTLYFWLYCVGFCYVFPKAQITWFYSGIWCMFLNWVVFSPFFLLIFSIVEMFSGKFNYHYYFKRLFCF